MPTTAARDPTKWRETGGRSRALEACGATDGGRRPAASCRSGTTAGGQRAARSRGPEEWNRGWEYYATARHARAWSRRRRTASDDGACGPRPDPRSHGPGGSNDALRYGRDRLGRRRNRRRSRRECHGRQRRWRRQRRRVYRGRGRQFGWRGRGWQLGRWRRRRQWRRRQRRRRQRRRRQRRRRQRRRRERRRGRQRWRGRQGDPGRQRGCCAACVRGGSGRAHEAHADECERCRQASTPRLGQSPHRVLNAYAAKLVTGLASPNGGAALTRASRRITL